jgi:hypothetical protein
MCVVELQITEAEADDFLGLVENIASSQGKQESN